jgi:hypothetical protein
MARSHYRSNKTVGQGIARSCQWPEGLPLLLEMQNLLEKDAAPYLTRAVHVCWRILLPQPGW